eukprot:486519-Hanusia_phi.AAC.1
MLEAFGIWDFDPAVLRRAQRKRRHCLEVPRPTASPSLVCSLAHSCAAARGVRGLDASNKSLVPLLEHSCLMFAEGLFRKCGGWHRDVLPEA